MKYLFTYLAILIATSSYAQQDTATLLNLADIAAKNKVYDKAIAGYTHLLEIDSTRDDVYMKRGVYYMENRMSCQAIDDMTRSIWLRPDEPSYYTMRADANFRVLKYDNAAHDSYKAIDLLRQMPAPNRALFKMGYATIGVAYKVKGMYAEAMTYLDSALAIDGNYRFAAYHKCDTYLEMDSVVVARAFLAKKACIQNPVDRACLLLKSVVKEENEMAIKSYIKEYKEQNQQWSAVGAAYLGYVYYKLGKIRPAMKYLDRAISKNEAYALAYKYRALAFIKDNALDYACADLQRALDHNYQLNFGDDILQLQQENCSK